MEEDLRRLIDRRERIRRHNRNVLQYAVAIAGVWGVVGGTEGVLAIARALQQQANGGSALPFWARWYLGWAGWVGIGISLFFGVMLAINLRRRQWHEKQWHKDLEQIKDQGLLQKILEQSE